MVSKLGFINKSILNNKYLSIGLSVLAVGGVVATIFSALNESPKLEKVIETHKDKEKIDKEIVIETTKALRKTIIFGTATVGCIIASSVISTKYQNTLLSALMLSQNSNNLLRKTKSLEEFDTLMSGAINLDGIPLKGEEKLFYDAYSGRFFKSTFINVLNAEYEANRTFKLKGDLPINWFYRYLDIPEIEGGDSFGWTTFLDEEGRGLEIDSWLDFSHKEKRKEDGTEYYILSYLWWPENISYYN